MQSIEKTLSTIGKLSQDNRLHHFLNLKSSREMTSQEYQDIENKICQVISLRKGDEVSVDILCLRTDNNQYKIDDLKPVLSHLISQPLELSYKYVIFNEAHKLSVTCQNKLLKVLEEPPIALKFIFISHTSKDFLPTIKSRFLQFHFVWKSKSSFEWDQLIAKLTTHELYQELKNDPDKMNSYLRFISDKISETSNFKLCDKILEISQKIQRKMELNLSLNLEISQLKELYLHIK